jgi:hypothetical protein
MPSRRHSNSSHQSRSFALRPSSPGSWNSHEAGAVSPGRIVAAPGALAALEEAGESPGIFIRRHVAGVEGKSTGTTNRKTSSRANTVPSPLCIRPVKRHENLDQHRGRPQRNNPTHAIRILMATIRHFFVPIVFSWSLADVEPAPVSWSRFSAQLRCSRVRR